MVNINTNPPVTPLKTSKKATSVEPTARIQPDSKETFRPDSVVERRRNKHDRRQQAGRRGRFDMRSKPRGRRKDDYIDGSIDIKV